MPEVRDATDTTHFDDYDDEDDEPHAAADMAGEAVPRGRPSLFGTFQMVEDDHPASNTQSFANRSRPGAQYETSKASGGGSRSCAIL